MDRVAEVLQFTELRRRFHALLELAAAQRAAAIEDLRAGNPQLADELSSLLVALDERDLTPTPTALPQQIGPFRILQRLGRGGMGEVFLAERIDQTFEQRVALKVVGQRGFSAELTQRFLRERRILARLSHPNIAHLIDGGFGVDGAPWLAMEYVDGLGVARWVSVNQPGLGERVRMVCQIAQVIAFAHRQLVVHRDLKPANILVAADGVPKLLDFGIAKLLDDSDGDSDITRTGLRALTLRYAAPEQVVGDQATTATDVHALGVLLHELICESSPWPQAEAGTQPWLQAILHAPPATLADCAGPALTSIERRRLGGDLQRIVGKALAKPTQDRYASASAMADDLDDWLHDRPLRSGIGSRRERGRHFLRLYRWPLLLLASVLVALSVGLLLALLEARRADDQRAIAEANLGSMIDVLVAAVPRDFQVREVTASEFLLHAAARLQADHGGNAELIRRAFGEIGLGLINLGEGERAEPILSAAIAASVRNGDSSARQLPLYKLLVFSQDSEAAVSRAEQTAQRIATLAADPAASASSAIDSLASAAGVLSRHGLFEHAEQLYQQAEQRRVQATDLADVSMENYWRQRGWTAWRAYRLDAAIQFLGQAASSMDKDPAALSPLRRAELQQLLAEVEAARGQADAAAAHLQQALPVFEREYPSAHPERARFDLIRARVGLLQGQPDAALRTLDGVDLILANHDASDRGALRSARWLRAEIETALGHCDFAIAATRAALASAPSTPRLPREIAMEAASNQAVLARCGESG